MPDYRDYEEYFKVGLPVRYESEWQPGKWEYGVIRSHYLRYGKSPTLRIEGEDGGMVDYDYRYLDSEDPRNSLVRLIKNGESISGGTHPWFRKV